MTATKQLKVLLISPSNGLVHGNPHKPEFQTHPLGLLYLAAVLEKDGCQVEICDAFSFGYDMDYIQHRITSFAPDIVGLTAMTILAPDCYAIAARAKELNPDIVTIMGGPHATAMSDEALTTGHINIVVRGEGEAAVIEICSALRQDSRRLGDIDGISYKTGQRIVTNPQRHPLMELDKLSMPAYHLLEKVSEYNPPPHWGKKGQFASLITSRGCPYGCLFCSVTRSWGKRYRFRSTENVMAEIRRLYDKYGSRYFSFRDSTLTLHKPRVIRLCKAIVEDRLDIKWNCNSRANEVNEEVLAWMKKAGCETIQFGIESGDEEMLRKFKNLDKEKIRNAIELTNRSGIKAHGYFMFGLPGETMESVKATIRFAKSLKLHSAGFTTVTPFPGSSLWDYCVENDMVTTQDWSSYNLKGYSVIKYPNFASDELLHIQKRAFRKFYLRPRILLHHLAKIKNANDLFNYIKESLVNFK